MTALTMNGKPSIFGGRSMRAAALGASRTVIGTLEKSRLELVLEQARRAGIGGTIADVLDDPRVVGVVARHFQVPQPSLEACRRYYQDHEDQFRQPDRYVGRQIVLRYPSGNPDLRAEVLARAERLIAILFFDPNMFGDLLASYDSLHDEKGSGRIGPVVPGILPRELESALFALRPGQICPIPVVTATAIHVVLLDRIFPGVLPSFEAVQDSVSAILRQQYRQAAAARHLARLAARYRKQYDGI